VRRWLHALLLYVVVVVFTFVLHGLASNSEAVLAFYLDKLLEFPIFVKTSPSTETSDMTPFPKAQQEGKPCDQGKHEGT